MGTREIGDWNTSPLNENYEEKRWKKIKVEVEEEAKRDIESKGQSCFVARVVYGDINASEVNILREYRDKVLMQSDFGRRFVELYYNDGGEKIANFVQEKAKFLIPIIRKGLDYIVKNYLERER